MSSFLYKLTIELDDLTPLMSHEIGATEIETRDAVSAATPILLAAIFHRADSDEALAFSLLPDAAVIHSREIVEFLLGRRLGFFRSRVSEQSGVCLDATEKVLQMVAVLILHLLAESELASVGELSRAARILSESDGTRDWFEIVDFAVGR